MKALISIDIKLELKNVGIFAGNREEAHSEITRLITQAVKHKQYTYDNITNNYGHEFDTVEEAAKDYYKTLKERENHLPKMVPAEGEDDPCYYAVQAETVEVMS